MRYRSVLTPLGGGLGVGGLQEQPLLNTCIFLSILESTPLKYEYPFIAMLEYDTY